MPLFFLLLFGSIAIGQPSVDKLGLKDGLSNSEIRSIYQDQQGYLWFGTYDGLNRYDGYDFKVYRNHPGDDHSIIHNYVNAISEDGDHNLWVGTRQGLSILDPVSQKFSAAYMTLSDRTRTALIRSYIFDVMPDVSGNMCVAGDEIGFVVFPHADRRHGAKIPYKDEKGDHLDYSVLAMASSNAREIYAMIDKVGLCSFDSKNQCLRLVDQKLQAASVIFVDKGGIWIGMSSGLWHYDLLRHVYDRHYSEKPEELTSSRITHIMSVSPDQLWVGTDGGGINILNTASNKFTYLKAGFSSQSLSSDAIRSLLTDRDGRVWIGTLRGGINVIDHTKDRFQNITHDPTNRNSLINNYVKSLFEENDRILWIGTDGGGLSIWDRGTNSFENFLHVPGKAGSLSSNFVTGICRDHTGKIWLTTYGGGIDLYQPASKTFKTYNGGSDPGKTTGPIFWCLLEDSDHDLWVSGLHNGFFRFDRIKDQFELFDPGLKNVLVLYEDKSKVLWGGTFDGIYEIDRKNKKHHYFPVGKPVRAIHGSESGQLWLGTEAGLMLFDKKSHRIIQKLTTDDGLCNNNVLNIQDDEHGHLWLSTYSGLSNFDLKKETFTNFFPSDGLQNKEFNFNASARLSSGQLAFGGNSGLTLFDPQRIRPLSSIPHLVITDIKVNNRSVSESPQYIRSVTRNHISALQIPFHDAALTIDFSAIEFSSQEKIVYRYMMAGWDRGWNNSGHLRSAVYTRLDPGTYQFKVKCTDPKGIWVDAPEPLTVVILPPWYATWWAYLAYLSAAVCLIYWYMAYRARETKLKYEIRLAKLNADNQMVLQEKEREINEKRVEFFTGIAHEFRTPLSLIINPARDLLKDHQGTGRNDLNIIYRNARRLLGLVDQLLLFRKADAGITQMNIAPMHIVSVCNEVFLSFVQQAAVAGIAYTFSPANSDLIVYGDREKIEIILYNLISNAIKYSRAGDSISVLVGEDAGSAIISIADTGHGVPSGLGDKIFEKYFRSNEPGQPVKAGFGIGLYLARQFAEDHSGSLTYDSERRTGTTFTLTLRKGTDHFPQDSISRVESETSELFSEITDHTGEQEPSGLPALDPVDFKAENIFSDKQTILIIDDDTEIRNYVRSILETNYLIHCAADGESGLLLANEKLPDLIICDVMMPGMNGIELCGIIKQDPVLNYIPMILLTASSSPEGKIKGLESGADDYISKPFEKEVLIARVANLLQIRKNLQSYFYSAVTLRSTNVNISEEYKVFLEKCIEVVEKHLTDQNFNTNSLASEIGMSRSNLFRKVKSLSGHSINSFIRYIRLRKAAELLIQTDMNINEVALETGFNSIKYFRTQFAKLFGANPSEFMRQKRPVFKKRLNVLDK
ncbi:two-component regulator propeller domain-containing protein [Mucilaginibacter sp. AW1-3]